MKKLRVREGVAGRPAVTTLAAATVALLLGTGGQAYGFNIETDNEDLKVRLDNTFRYSLGVRTQKRDPLIAATTLYSSSDLKADRGDVITNRVDLFTEFDAVYKDKTGFRLSTSLWFDRGIGDEVKTNPAHPEWSAYYGKTYSSTTKRYAIGPSGEIKDAFLFHTFMVGDVPINVKAGRLVNYWGESLFALYSGISYAQAPADLYKALANPGTETKELFMPSRQISFQASLSTEWSVAGYKGFEGFVDRIPNGGTYFGDNDLLYDGTQKINLSALGVPANVDIPRLESWGPRPRGDWGLNTRYTPSWMNGTIGVYYRQFDEKIPGSVQFTPTFDAWRLSYTRDTKLWGFSVASQFAGVSLAGEVNFRRNAGLLGSGPLILNSDVDTNPRGNMVFGIVNGIAYFGKNSLWDQSVLIAELNFGHLQKITQHAELWSGGDNCRNEKWQGCATKTAYGFNVSYIPSWNQFWPSVDVKMPLNFGMGLKGNVATPGCCNQGAGSYSFGAIASVSNKYDFELKYIGYLTHTQNNGTAITAHNGQGNSLITDRGWVSFTFKTSF